METEEKKEKCTHHGHALKRIRTTLGIKQGTIAAELDMTQGMISIYEGKKVIEDEMIDKFATALGVPSKYIKELEEDPVTIIVENNKITNENNDKVTNAAYVVDNSTNQFNPVDKIVELCEKLLEKEQEKIALLEKLLKDKK